MSPKEEGERRRVGLTLDEIGALARNLRRITADGKPSARALSVAIGANPRAISDMIDGRVGSPSYAVMRSIAKVLGTSPEALLGNAPPDNLPESGSPVTVKGSVEVGVWRESLEWESGQRYTVPIRGDDRRYPGIPIFGLEIRGGGMGRKLPASGVALCVGVSDLDRAPRPGETFVVRSSRAGLSEYTIRKCVEGRNRPIAFLVDSDSVPTDVEMDDGLEAVALVTMALIIF